MSPTLLWFRQDLRVQDHPALHGALARGGAVIPVYVWDGSAAAAAAEESPGETRSARWRTGAAARWWLHHSLAALDASLRERGSRLVLLAGDPESVLPRMARAVGAGAVYWNRRYEPEATRLEPRVTAALGAAGVEAKSFRGSVLHEPGEIANNQGRPFQVFTAYWRRCLTLPVAAPLKLPPGPLPAPGTWPESLPLDMLELLPRVRWDVGLARRWTPGEQDAGRRLDRFVAGAIDRYDLERDLPGCEGTSLLSPSLAFGEVSPRQVWAAVRARGRTAGVFPPSNGARVFLSEIGWREFAYQVLYHFPHAAHTPLRAEFARFPWAEDPGGTKLLAWQRGGTGYPLVDAGMRELWETGWMHNRMRMVVASFLVKHLRLPWTEGAAWFNDTLVDADLANNTLGWQWSAGCGVDAAPYFRIFAPVLQGKKFDGDGTYVRRWVPELAKVPDKYLHAPWEAPADVLAAAGVALGETYPRPIVEHATARDAALAAFKTLRSRPV